MLSFPKNLAIDVKNYLYHSCPSLSLPSCKDFKVQTITKNIFPLRLASVGIAATFYVAYTSTSKIKVIIFSVATLLFTSTIALLMKKEKKLELNKNQIRPTNKKNKLEVAKDQISPMKKILINRELENINNKIFELNESLKNLIQETENNIKIENDMIEFCTNLDTSTIPVETLKIDSQFSKNISDRTLLNSEISYYEKQIKETEVLPESDDKYFKEKGLRKTLAEKQMKLIDAENHIKMHDLTLSKLEEQKGMNAKEMIVLAESKILQFRKELKNNKASIEAKIKNLQNEYVEKKQELVVI